MIGPVYTKKFLRTNNFDDGTTLYIISHIQ